LTFVTNQKPTTPTFVVAIVLLRSLASLDLCSPRHAFLGAALAVCGHRAYTLP
jgi:hypothetical protein